ncbi:YfbR-like 5'-deoxynucleotidase [Nitratireductor pacificus]|uniref:Metal dependent phosphohydrolase n=1 Tax=Nitratireductor pacificus pht-3B TaxID=391937 RepID=K2N8E4_9HYPH|nr:HD family hydrolase [Nitratireductor pacificus]EKF20378.1 metal dependent phosphohydrolase [Nitratireductor pacificus pht-3B]
MPGKGKSPTGGAKTGPATTQRAWQRMLSGRRLDLLDPSPLDIEIGDIAHGLARVARWNGQTEGDHAYSVAQHSLLVEQVFGMVVADATPDMLLATLLHDAPEYVIGDMISPFKATLGDDYKSVEKRLQRAIHLRFALRPDLKETLKKAIKRADRVAAFYEATRLARFDEAEAARFFGRPRGVPPETLDLAPLPAKRAQKAFIVRFEAIEAMRVDGPGSRSNI